MTSRGYDPKAISMPKSIKRRAATILNDHKRGEYFRSWVKVLDEQRRSVKKEK